MVSSAYRCPAGRLFSTHGAEKFTWFSRCVRGKKDNRRASSAGPKAHKKTDVATAHEGFRHIGLLVTHHLAWARLLFIESSEALAGEDVPPIPPTSIIVRD
jgi:hypothetical protein